ncbi:MAG: hypothetical protein Ct9H300mP14_05960 [Gammaproteobacteria bacterium]|nr:MAG: hypothetical protein Ct9H300mP14_05960 [Gammaproteobacteria bacterium]
MIPNPGPESSLQRWEFYFESEQPTESEQAYLDWTINTLIPEDTALYENVQHGLRSQGYSQGRFVINRNRPEWSEHHVHQFQKLVTTQFGEIHDTCKTPEDLFRPLSTFGRSAPVRTKTWPLWSSEDTNE